MSKDDTGPASAALKLYASLPGIDSDMMIRDLAADLGHIADNRGLDGLTELSAAIRHYLAEKHDDDTYHDGGVAYIHPSEIKGADSG